MRYKDVFLTIDNDRKLNLKHVSSISLDYSRDKIIFKLDYAINPIIKKGNDLNYDNSDVVNSTKSHDMRKISTGYIYTYGIQDVLNRLYLVPYFDDNFIKKNLKPDDHDDLGYINLENVTSIKFESNKNRVVINFSNSVTFYDYNTKDNILTSEFLYLDFLSDERFKNYVDYINKFI